MMQVAYPTVLSPMKLHLSCLMHRPYQYDAGGGFTYSNKSSYIQDLVMLLVLSLTLVNYFYRDNVKSLYLFLGALCIVFGEVIWVAYIYISASTFLNIISTSLYALSFYFFYEQSKLFYEEIEEEVNVLINE